MVVNNERGVSLGEEAFISGSFSAFLLWLFRSDGFCHCVRQNEFINRGFGNSDGCFLAIARHLDPGQESVP